MSEFDKYNEHEDSLREVNDLNEERSNLLELTREVVASFPGVQDVEIKFDSCVMFAIDDNLYMLCPPTDILTGMPSIYTERRSETNPHILLEAQLTTNSRIGSLCLFESGSVVGLYLGYKDRVELCISRLLDLIYLSRKEKENEFQKEFLYYWNRAANMAIKSKMNRKHLSNYYLFLSDNSKGEWLNVLEYRNDEVRLFSNDIQFNNRRSAKQHTGRIQALYLPIVDASGIVPPTDEKPWGAEHISDIICGVQVQRISSDMFCQLSEFSYSHKTVLLVFKLKEYFFGCIVEFKNGGTAKLTIKIESQIECVIPIRIERADFSFLNTTIGNGNKVNMKKVAIVGAGSLGSYVAEELLRTGIKQFVIIDADVFDTTNTMRHRLDFDYNHISKADSLAIKLECTHPEVIVIPVNQYIGPDNCLSIIPEDADIVIFTVGSTDIQVSCNRIFKANAYKKPVLFSWLEGDGESSHVAAIQYDRPGCFECLFTGDDEKYCECKINVSKGMEPTILRNGCGGTRVAYGNSTLLSATKIVLEAVSKCFSDKIEEEPNFTVSYQNRQIINTLHPVSEHCVCCSRCP